MFRLYAIIAVVGMLGVAAWGAKYYYDSTQATIAQLRENNAKLEVVAKTNEETISRLNQDAVQMAALNTSLQQELQQAEVYKEELLGKLQKHNLSQLSLKKPGLIEKRINDATAKVFDDLESLTSPISD